MYVNPFVAGIIITLMTECILAIISAIVVSSKKNNNGGNNNG